MREVMRHVNDVVVGGVVGFHMRPVFQGPSHPVYPPLEPLPLGPPLPDDMLEL